MYNALATTGDVAAALGSGVTYSALNLLEKFLFNFGSINIVSTYDQVYYFSKEKVLQGGVEVEKHFLTMTMTPIGLGINFGTFTSITSYPTATYRFELTFPDPNDELTFETGIPMEVDAGAREYYSGNITRAIIDGLKMKTFRLQWSEVGVQRGMVVEFRPVNASEADSHVNVFIPPAILTTR